MWSLKTVWSTTRVKLSLEGKKDYWSIREREGWLRKSGELKKRKEKGTTTRDIICSQAKDKWDEQHKEAQTDVMYETSDKIIGMETRKTTGDYANSHSCF